MAGPPNFFPQKIIPRPRPRARGYKYLFDKGGLQEPAFILLYKALCDLGLCSKINNLQRSFLS